MAPDENEKDEKSKEKDAIVPLVQLYAHFCYQLASRNFLRKSFSPVTTLVAHKKTHACTHTDKESFTSTFSNSPHLRSDEETPDALGKVHMCTKIQTQRMYIKCKGIPNVPL